MKVSLCVFTYNQSNFIAEAVNAAINQTYRPLEIIISDDCSTDNTFEIVQDIVNSLVRDPGLTIKLNKNEKNLGIGGHVKLLSELASGDVLVFAAGDDISHSDRVAEIVKAMASDKEVKAVFTDMRYIENDGSVNSTRPKRYKGDIYPTIADMLFDGGGVAAGASYAYRREVLFWPHEYPESIMCEDRILPLRARLLGRVQFLDIPLVDYRLSDAGVSRAIPRKVLDVRSNKLHVKELVGTLKFARLDGKLSAAKYFFSMLQLSGMRSCYSTWYRVAEVNTFAGKIVHRLIFYYFSFLRRLINISTARS